METTIVISLSISIILFIVLMVIRFKRVKPKDRQEINREMSKPKIWKTTLPDKIDINDWYKHIHK